MFLALLTKELRLRFRNERSIWVLVIYVLLLGLIGIISLTTITNGFPSSNYLSNAGRTIYYLLSIIQLLLIIFVTPAFTASSINGEKERQTYDLLLSSQLSSFTLAGGKLLAGLMNVLVLIAATIPLFSLVFFFGGVSPRQFGAMLVIFCVTVFLVGTTSLFLSTILRRPAISTAIAYVICLFWLGFPILLFSLFRDGSSINDITTVLVNFHPLLALLSIEPIPGINTSSWLGMPSWLLFTCTSLLVTIFIFWLTTLFIRPKFFRT